MPTPIVTSTHQRALVDTGSTVGEADCSATGALDKKIDSIDGGNGCADIAGRNREFYSVRAVDIQPPRANPTDMVTALPSINYRRLVLAGLVAIVVLLVCQVALIGSLSSTIMAARDAAHLPVFVPRPVLSLLELLSTGYLIVWMYAAIRPRFGPGIGTAVRSGLAVWFCLGVIVTIHMISDNFGFPPGIIMLIAAGMLPALVLASIAGAWAYRE